MNIARLMDNFFRRGYLAEVRKQLAVLLPGQEFALTERIAANADTLLAENQHFAIDTPAVSNLKITSLALATYRVVLDCGVERRAALGFVKNVLLEPNRKKMAMMSKLTLRFTREPLKLMASISKGKQTAAYGKAFDFEHDTDDMRTYFTTTVKKCLYHDFFRANGAPEMTAVFCSYDDLWGDTIATGEYGVKFTRPTTIGWGHEMCRFEFKRAPRRKSS
jgi:hypothetical protein